MISTPYSSLSPKEGRLDGVLKRFKSLVLKIFSLSFHNLLSMVARHIYAHCFVRRERLFFSSYSGPSGGRPAFFHLFQAFLHFLLKSLHSGSLEKSFFTFFGFRIGMIVEAACNIDVDTLQISFSREDIES